jgi:hypothetical protein
MSPELAQLRSLNRPPKGLLVEVDRKRQAACLDAALDPELTLSFFPVGRQLGVESSCAGGKRLFRNAPDAEDCSPDDWR